MSKRRPAAVPRPASTQAPPERPADPGERPATAETVTAHVPSSLDLNTRPSAARSGGAELRQRIRNHPETGPDLTGGDVDADWESAYSVGDEAPGGDNPTPGQAVVEDVARALGVEYRAEDELRSAETIESRDKHRWELDPASAEDYAERTKPTARQQQRKNAAEHG